MGKCFGAPVGRGTIVLWSTKLNHKELADCCVVCRSFILVVYVFVFVLRRSKKLDEKAPIERETGVTTNKGFFSIFSHLVSLVFLGENISAYSYFFDRLHFIITLMRNRSPWEKICIHNKWLAFIYFRYHFSACTCLFSLFLLPHTFLFTLSSWSCNFHESSVAYNVIGCLWHQYNHSNSSYKLFYSFLVAILTFRRKKHTIVFLL